MTPYALILSAICCLTITSACAEDLAESFPESIYQAKVSIIIDDLGYSLKQGHLFMAFPFDLTISVIPFTPYSTDIAKLANRFDKEVMLHAPMETLGQKQWERGLHGNMNEQELANAIDKMLANVPHAKGMNNHGGSRLTQDAYRMRWIMTHLEKRQLYFIDSRTTASTTAIYAASKTRIAHDSRDVFLDNVKEHHYIREQLQKLINLALKNGSAIGIGHPYPETLAILAEQLPTFSSKGIQVVSASQIATKGNRKALIAPKNQHIASLEAYK